MLTILLSILALFAAPIRWHATRDDSLELRIRTIYGDSNERCFHALDSRLSKGDKGLREMRMVARLDSSAAGLLCLIRSMHDTGGLTYLVTLKSGERTGNLHGFFQSPPIFYSDKLLRWVDTTSYPGYRVESFAAPSIWPSIYLPAPSRLKVTPLGMARTDLDSVHQKALEACVQDSVRQEDFFAMTAQYRSIFFSDAPTRKGASMDLGKPMIYLHPRKPQHYKITLGRSISVSASYPALVDRSWSVEAFPDGSLHDSTGKTYYGLFWAGDYWRHPHLDSAFVVSQARLPAFLDSILELQGLDYREREECVTFWMEKLAAFPWVRAQFFNHAFDVTHPIHIEPPVDQFLRICMVFQGLADPVITIPQLISRHAGRGNYAVEWGGEISQP